MATYKQHYNAGKRRAAKKMTAEQRRKLAEARRLTAIQDGEVHNFSLCKKCGYYYQRTCTFDGSEDPAKNKCENFAPRK